MSLPHVIRSCMRVGLAELTVVVCLLQLGLPASGKAQARNGYGTRGRTVVSLFAGGFKSTADRVDPTGHDATWSTGVHLTLAHFWIDNLAVGGTLLGGTAHVDDETFDQPSRSWAGGDLDILGHVPLNRRLSLRFWLWGGLRWNEYVRRSSRDGGLPGVVAGPTSSAFSETERVHALSFVAAFTPEMLLHLSPSVAVSFGPTVTLRRRLSGVATSAVELGAGPTMSYSFGPDEEQHRTLGDARVFGAKGRNIMQLYGVFNQNTVKSGVSFSRFIVDHFALGVYADGGTNSIADNFMGAGLQALTDLPIAQSLSLLVAPRAGYEWSEVEVFRSYQPSDYYVGLPAQDTPWVTVHELHLAVPVYLSLHLHDGLVVGLGPQLVYDWRMGGSSARSLPNVSYLQAGLASTLIGSF